MHINPKMVTKLALIGLAAASMTACSRPKPELASANPMPTPTTSAPTTTPSAPTTSSPTTSAPSAASTAPVPGSVQDFVVNVGDRVYFDYDQYSVRDDARPILDAQAQWLQRYPSVRVRIEGNADERGTREYNFALGARRADAVRDYLIARGVSPNRIETVSYGKERPIDPGSNEQAWARNRNGHTAIVAGAQ